VNYTCADGGSGVATCQGGIVGANGTLTPVANGKPLDTSKPGTFTFRVTATDGAGNTSTVNATYTVTYDNCAGRTNGLAGRVVSVAVVLCDASGKNVGDTSITLTAVSLDGGPVTPFVPGLNPPFVFAFNKGQGQYIFTLDGKTLSSGSHTLGFTVPGDPVVHIVTFVLT
jgi:hypothetical protein